MKKIIVRGGYELNGDVYISGMKNAALPIIFACILSKGKNILYNVPRVTDIELSFEISVGEASARKDCGKRFLFCLCRVSFFIQKAPHLPLIGRRKR